MTQTKEYKGFTITITDDFLFIVAGDGHEPETHEKYADAVQAINDLVGAKAVAEQRPLPVISLCAGGRGMMIRNDLRPSTTVTVVFATESNGLDWHLYDANGTWLASYATKPEANAAAEVWRALSDMPSQPCPDPMAHVILRSPIQPLADLFRTAIDIADVISPNRDTIIAGQLAQAKYVDALRAFVAAVKRMETVTALP